MDGFIFSGEGGINETKDIKFDSFFSEIGFNTMKDKCLIEYGTVHGDMFFFFFLSTE